MHFCKNEKCKQSFIPSEDTPDNDLGYCTRSCRVLDIGEPREHKMKPVKAGVQVSTLEELHQACIDRRSDICSSGMFSHRAFPASFVINTAGSCLIRMFRSGMWIYEKK